MSETRQAFETQLQVLHTQGNFEQVLSQALERYGQQLAGLQLKMLRHDAIAAEDAWSIFLEQAWRGLPGFAWRAQLRTWLFLLARNAVSRLHRGAHHKQHFTSLTPALAQAAQRTFTTAIGYDTAADHFMDYFDRLDLEDQWICALRIGCRLSWRDVANIVNDWGDATIDSDVERKECARIRNRFNRMQQRMRAWAQDEGLRLR